MYVQLYAFQKWRLNVILQLTTGNGTLVASFTPGKRKLFGAAGDPGHIDVSRDAFNDLDEIIISTVFIAKIVQRRRAAAVAAATA